MSNQLFDPLTQARPVEPLPAPASALVTPPPATTTAAPKQGGNAGLWLTGFAVGLLIGIPFWSVVL